MNKANSLHNPYKLEEFTAQWRWYQLDSHGRISMKQLLINSFTRILHCTDTTTEVQTDP